MTHAFDLDRLAELAQLELSEEERSVLLRDMERLVSFADRLTMWEQDFDEEIACQAALRADVPFPCTPRTELLRSAPTHTDQYITVPKTVTEEDCHG
ncbi:MAG: hypothetical protein E7668_01690 [Ruminococcaceae bacterium]|nr:hypothetical protein [Oscillospiraceae bacterium]